MSDAQWYYAVGNEQRGPSTEAELGTVIASGEIGPDTLVWRDGMESWSAARSSLPGTLIPQGWVDGLPQSATAVPPMFGQQAATAQPYAGETSGDYYHPTQFMDVVRTVFGRYVSFKGRARRSEYWYWVLFVVLASIALAMVDGFIFGFDETDLAVVGPLFSLGTFLPSIGVAFRRIHDLGKSAWWLLLGLIPLIGTIILLVWFARKGDEGPNAYGPA